MLFLWFLVLSWGDELLALGANVALTLIEQIECRVEIGGGEH